MKIRERRTEIVGIVVILLAFHFFASGSLIRAETVSNPEMRASLETLYAEYAAIWQPK